MSKPKVVSLFSGGGGMDLGFEKAGYDIIFSTDNWPIAIETLKKRKKEKKQRKIIELNNISNVNFQQIKDKHKDIDCVIGGPPCPPFSKSRFYLEKKPRALEDPEGYLTLKEYFRAIKELNPYSFVFENVPGFVFKPHKEALNLFNEYAKELGYITPNCDVLNCADFGIPQIRERFFAIGIKDKVFEFPSPTHFDLTKIDHLHEGQINIEEIKNAIKARITCGEAIGDLDFPLDEDENNQAGSKHAHLLKQVPPGENYLFFTKERGHPNPEFKWRSRYWSFLLKLSPDLPSWTIQASFSNNQGPFHWSNRFLRIAEIKRLQSFPDDYEFCGEFKDQWRQIGNAVPPLMAEILAKKLKEYF